MEFDDWLYFRNVYEAWYIESKNSMSDALLYCMY